MNPRPDAAGSAVPSEPEAAARSRADADRLIGIADIRALFKLGRSAAYELTHRPGFPAPVPVSRRCLRWWASEVAAYADALQRDAARPGSRPARRRMPQPATPPRRITGTTRLARRRQEAP